MTLRTTLPPTTELVELAAVPPGRWATRTTDGVIRQSLNSQVVLARRTRGIRQPGEAQQLVVPEDPLYVRKKRSADEV